MATRTFLPPPHPPHPSSRARPGALLALLLGGLLAAGSEAAGAPAPPAMGAGEYVVELREVAAQATAVVRFRVRPAEVGAEVARVLPTVYAHVAEQGVTPGTPFARYLGSDGDLVAMEVGLRVARPVRGDGTIEPGQLPAGPVAFTWHEGSHEGLPAAHRALAGWAKEHGQLPAGGPWELYVTDPGREPDPAKWRTRVELPLVPRDGP